MAAIYICFANQLQRERSEVLGPFTGIDMTYGSLRATDERGDETSIAYHGSDGQSWEYNGQSYGTVLFVTDPRGALIEGIAVDAQ